MTSPRTRSPGVSPVPAARPNGLLCAAGLGRATAGWARDLHWRWAWGAALPVWVGLGLMAGRHLRAPVGAADWASLVIVQPLLEEIVLRGLVQGASMAWTAPGGVLLRVGPVSVANAIATGCFVALHLGHQPWPWAWAVAVPSLILGHLRERLGSAWPGVLLHAGYNLGFGLVATAVRLLA